MKIFKTLVVLFNLGLALSLDAQDFSQNVQKDSIVLFEDFFDREDPLEISLEFDLKTFQRERSKEEYIEAKLIYQYNENKDFSFPVRLKSRGIFRKSYCYIPPFWINIYNSGINSDALAGIKKIKIVTHCMTLKNYQDYLLKEYLAYKIYNIISPYSFKVRLLKIKYIDTGRNKKEFTGWAIAIEPIELLADRLDARIIENKELAKVRMNPSIMDRLSIYYYMIGNTDYSVTGLHNVKLLMLNNPGPAGYIPVPYDFDFTGIVNSPYSKPAKNVPVSKVTERYYQGICRSDQIYEMVIEDFKGYSDEIYELLQSFEFLSLDQKNEILQFIDEFYMEIARDNFISDILMEYCR
jgi:hypothetical protein